MIRTENELAMYAAYVEAERDELRQAMRAVALSKDIEEARRIARDALARTK